MAHRCKKQCRGSRRRENQAMTLTVNSTIIGGTAPKDVTCRTGNRMKQNRLILVVAGVWIWLAAWVAESGATSVPYSQLTPPQKQAYALQVQRFGLTADQADKLLDADYLLKVELPGYRQCPVCRGTGASSYETSKVKGTIQCSYCQGGGRIQRKIDPAYTYKDPNAQTFGTVKSETNYEFIDCPKCGGSGRMVVYACADCGGAGMVAAGHGLYIIGKSQKAASPTNTFDVLHLRNGKEINRVQVTKIAGDEAELRHAAGMGKYRRGDFMREDAAKLFGEEPEAAGGVPTKESLIDMTVGSFPHYLGNCVLDMKDMRLLTLLMSMGVALDYENSPYLVLAIDKGETNTVAALLSKDASVNARDARGRSALRAAVEKGDRDLVSNLLAHDADPNTRDAKSATPLHVAAAKGDVDLVDYLIDHGARMDLADKEGRTPVDYAKRSPLGKKVAEKFEIQNTDYARAKTLMAEGKFDDAIAIYGKYKDRMAVQSAMVSKGANFEGRGQLEDALQTYKEANDADGVQRVTGLLQGRQDKLIEAQNLEKAIRLDDARAAYVQAGAPDDAKRLALQLAKEMETAKEYPKAAWYYEQAEEWDAAGQMRKLEELVVQEETRRESGANNQNPESVSTRVAPEDKSHDKNSDSGTITRFKDSYPLLDIEGPDPDDLYPAIAILREKLAVFPLVELCALNGGQTLLNDSNRLLAFKNATCWIKPQHVHGDVYRVIMNIFDGFSAYGEANVQKLSWLVNTKTKSIEAESALAQLFIDAQNDERKLERLTLDYLAKLARP